MSRPRVAFVTVVYRDSANTIELIFSLAELFAKDDMAREEPLVVIVDNSECETYFDEISSALCSSVGGFAVGTENSLLTENVTASLSFSRQGLSVVLLKSKKNGGFSYGNNIGIDVALKDQSIHGIWFINNDCLVNEFFLPAYWRYKESKNIFSGIKVVYFDKPSVIQGVAGKYGKKFGRIEIIGQGKNVSDCCGILSELDYPIGAAMFLSRDVVESIGKFCEDYFLYFEELDYASRCKPRGVSVEVFSDAYVLHKVGQSIGTASTLGGRSDFSEYYLNRSRVLYAKKHSPKTFYKTYALIHALRLLMNGRSKLALRIAILALGRYE